VIESLEPTENPKEWVLILRCEEMTFDLINKRVERVQMTLNDFEGIKVPREAIRFNKNNEKGCYVLWGQRVLMKKIDPIFEAEDYILSRLTSNEEYVCVYDDIIIKGVDTAAFMANSDEIVTEDEDFEEDEFVIPVASEVQTGQGVISETEMTSETELTEPSETVISEITEETEEPSETVSEEEIHFE